MIKINTRFWTKEKIIEALKKLPQDRPINQKILLEYWKKGLICHPNIINIRIGTIREACKLSNILCGTKEVKERVKYLVKYKKKWTKDKILKTLKKLYEDEGWINPKDLAKYLVQKKIFSLYIIYKHFGSIRNALEEAEIKYQGHFWTNKRIIENLYNLYQQYGSFSKTEINTKFLKQKISCNTGLICNRFGSLEKAAEYAGIKFKRPEINREGLRLGKNEKNLLDKIEQEKGTKLIRQYYVSGKYIDGYDKENNVAYEIDEIHHKGRQVEDCIREQQIKNTLDCEFIRIKDNW